MLKSFKTVNQAANAEIIEKKSRFIASVKPISSEEEALAFVAEIKKKHWDATHNVFAYQFGERNEVQRQSDDGEPSGTAGLPVLDVLRGEDIKNTVIVVTRYFGGTLLGTGGLVRAYGKAAKEGVLAAGIIEKILYKYIFVTVDYNFSGKVQYETLQMGHVIYNTEYTDKVKFTVLCEVDSSEGFVKRMTDISGGCADISDGGEGYGKWIDGELFME